MAPFRFLSPKNLQRLGLAVSGIPNKKEVPIGEYLGADTVRKFAARVMQSNGLAVSGIPNEKEVPIGEYLGADTVC